MENETDVQLLKSAVAMIANHVQAWDSQILKSWLDFA